MTIFTEVFQVGTHETERLVFRSFLDLVDPFYSFLVENIAADTVNSICGVADNPSLAQMLNNLAY